MLLVQTKQPVQDVGLLGLGLRLDLMSEFDELVGERSAPEIRAPENPLHVGGELDQGFSPVSGAELNGSQPSAT